MVVRDTQKYPNLKVYNWQEYHTMLDHFCAALMMSGRCSEYKYKKIYGVPRGGLIPAVVLSHKLGLPLVDREDLYPLEGTIVVDDLIDTGATYEQFDMKAGSDKMLFATMYTKSPPCVRHSANIFSYIYVTSDTWLKFPYEVED